jgi:hypothetical protein
VSLADWPELRTDELLEALTRRGVDFVVIGGFAVVLQGSARVTLDLDICFATDAGNIEALGQALTELGAKLADVDEDVPFVADAATLRRVELLTLVTPAGKLDVHVRPAGAPQYRSLRSRADRYDLGGFSVLVASIDDLIAMKLAAHRAKDLADVEQLEALKRASG